MGEDDNGVTFAGLGEPLLRLGDICESVRSIREVRHGVPFRIKTNGLVPGGNISSAVEQLVGSGIKSASVYLPCVSPDEYNEIMKPSDGLGFGNVCDFICQLAEAGAHVECTTVDRPGVDVASIRALSQALGALDTRVVNFHE